MSFGNNVLYYRKKCNITQEELAEKLDVTRQTVSRWETDSAFPDMEKLLELCKIFDCNMDVLVRGDAQAEGEKTDTKALEEYDSHMNLFTKFITAGVGLVLLGLSCMFLVNAIFSNEVAGLIVFLLFVTVSVSLFISSGISHGNFVSEHPHIEEYPKEQKKSFMRKMPFLISGATALVLIGVIILIALTYNDGYAPSGFTREKREYVVTSVFFVFIAVASSIFVFSGMQASKYNLKGIGNEALGASGGNPESKSEKIIGAVSGTIMLSATCIFLLLGFLKNIWHPSWVVFPIGGMLCGIVSIIVKAIFGEK